MRLFHSVLTPAVSVLAATAAIAVGCTVNVDRGGGSQNGGAGSGTTPIAQSQAHALVTGKVDSSVGGNVQMGVNDQMQPTVLAPDDTFVVRDVPLGDVKLSCDADGIHGELIISGVQAGEIIEVTIKKEGNAIVIVIETRTKASDGPREVSQSDGDALVVTSSHVCYWFKAGHYGRDIIVKGDDVHLFGAAHDSCVIDDFTILDGKLELDGNGITVFDVELNGTLVIAGHDDKVQDTCTKCFNQGCQHACGDDEQPGHTCTGGSDGGTPPPVDAGQGDGGGVTDAGTTDGAPPPYDAAPSDAGWGWGG
jgi:hypothetical protein